MPRVIAITGTPGTGKTTMARFLAKKIKNSKVIAANDIVNEKHLYTSRAPDGAKIVQLNKLEKELEKAVKADKGNIILEGHLLCEIKIKGATAIVLREHLATIRKRLLKRGYPKSKVNDNLISEAIDYCGEKSRRMYGDVFEILNDRNAGAKALGIAKGRKPGRRSIDLLNELSGMIKIDPSILKNKAT